MKPNYPINKKYILKLKLNGNNNDNAYEEIKVFDNLDEIKDYIDNMTCGFEFKIEPFYYYV